MKDSVEIELGGKTRHIRYDFNAAALAEQAMSRLWGERTTLQMVAKELKKREISYGNLRAMLWAGLYHETPDLTEEEVGEWLTPDNMPDVFQKIWESVTRHLFGREKPPFPKKKSSANSGPSPAST